MSVANFLPRELKDLKTQFWMGFRVVGSFLLCMSYDCYLLIMASTISLSGNTGLAFKAQSITIKTIIFETHIALKQIGFGTLQNSTGDCYLRIVTW